MAGIYEKLLDLLEKDRIKTGEEMKKHTTFRVGGPAAFFVTPKDEKELAQTVSLCRREAIPFFLLGNGSNLLVADTGFDGVVVSMSGLCGCEADAESGLIRAGAGISLAKIAKEAFNASLTGFEFAAGIPGSLGGAVVMNAGAYGSELKDVLCRAKVLTPEGELKKLSGEELCLGYRTSCVMSRGYIVTEAEICLKPGDKEAVKARMDELAGKRKEKQPLDYPSAGSTFKRPEGKYAGELIEKAGLKGFALGGAQVSEKHCGFVINRNHATAREVMSLIEEVKKRVYETSQVELEMEVKTLGKF